MQLRNASMLSVGSCFRRWNLYDSNASCVSPAKKSSNFSIIIFKSILSSSLSNSNPYILTYCCQKNPKKTLYILTLQTVPRILTKIGITVTFTFHNIFRFLARSKYLFIFLLSFIFTLWSNERQDQLVIFLLLINMRFGILAGIW